MDRPSSCDPGAGRPIESTITEATNDAANPAAPNHPVIASEPVAADASIEANDHLTAAVPASNVQAADDAKTTADADAANDADDEHSALTTTAIQRASTFQLAASPTRKMSMNEE